MAGLVEDLFLLERIDQIDSGEEANETVWKLLVVTEFRRNPPEMWSFSLFGFPIRSVTALQPFMAVI